MAMTPGQEHFVVAIGASAGGLEAIHEFFDHMRESENLSFIIIQHLSSDYKSLLVELVSRHTHMKVSEAENGMDIQTNCIYVIPNNKFITTKKNKLLLEDKKSSAMPNNAIDTFLYSLATDKQDKAIAVILSGTGSDGTRGVEAIKNNQGRVIVQDPSTAKFDGMPNSVIALGIADQVLSPADMPAEIVSYTRDPQPLHQPAFTESQLDLIFSLIHESAGFDFHYYKLPTITRRIARRMAQLDISTTDQYIDLLQKDKAECRQLANDFLIGVTRFFRDPEAWSALQEVVSSDILPYKGKGDVIKAWVCASSTGEEAYSLAIMLNELVAKHQKDVEIKIFASDIDEVSVDIAARGCYPDSIEKDVDPELLAKYFVRKGSQYHIVQSVRKQIVFTKHDVIKDPPFINNDLVSCRNMLIYMSAPLQKKVYALLLFALNKNGLLFLGASEHSSFIKDHVRDVSPRWKIYKKIKDSRMGSVYLSTMTARSAPEAESGMRRTESTRRPPAIWEAMKDVITSELGIAAFFIDDNFDIRESAGNYERLLSLPKKTLKLNLLGMSPPELYSVLASETRRARRESRTVTLKNLRARKGDIEVFWDVVIRPGAPNTLVVVSEHSIETPVAAGARSAPPAEDEYVSKLENELEDLRSHLALAVEDLETTNEELQSTNEELLSANEELQSSNEELQSLNEELHTLNTEHQLKIRELLELNDDLNNYFRSTDIAQVFVDRNLSIRRFNAASSNLINFIETDIGRPLEHISTNIGYDNFIADVRKALHNEQTEKEIAPGNGKNMLMRIMPYLNRDREVAGVIISFVDITTLTELNNTIRAVLNSSPGFILGFKAVRSGKRIDDFILHTANTAAAKFLQKPEQELLGSSLKKDIPKLTEDGLFHHFVRLMETGRQLSRDLFIASENRWYSVIASTMNDGFVVTVSDITDKKKAEQRLKANYQELVAARNNLKSMNEQLENKIIERTMALGASEERFRLVARATNDALWEWNLVNNTMWLGETFFKLFGYDGMSDTTSRSFWLSKLHPDDEISVTRSLHQAIHSGGNQWSIEYRFRKESGEYAHILDRGYILHDELGTPYRMLGSMFDVTELKNAQQKLATMNEQLEQKVMERTHELELMNSALELSNNDLQQFASVASHDLQEPLRKIQMFATLIQESYQDDPSNANFQYVEKILHSSQRMRSLIVDILNYSRLSASVYNVQLTDLNELIRGTLDDFELTIREKKATLHIDPLPEAEVIPGQIRQVFQNLLSNALKFSHPSVPPVITITHRRLAKRSFMSMPQENGPYHQITVSDNGIGFDPQFAENIFNLFQRLHSKDKFEGTGIGLAVTKRIIEKHNGLIRASSRENEGASFSIIIPARQG